MSLNCDAVLQRSRFLRAAVAACVAPTVSPRDIAHTWTLSAIDSAEVSGVRIGSAVPAPCTEAGGDAAASLAATDPDMKCSRTASCRCTECVAAMTELTGTTDGGAGGGKRLGITLQAADDVSTFARYATDPSVCNRVLSTDRGANAVGGWLRGFVGATSALREQMEVQEGVLAALDGLAVQQQRSARAAEVATDTMLLPFHEGTVLARLLFSRSLGAVVSLCAGPSDCMRWRALSLLLHCRCADGNAIAKAEGIPFLEPDAYACSPRIHHLSDKVYTQLYDADVWLEPLAAAGLTPASTIVALTKTELTNLHEGCERVSSVLRGGGEVHSDWEDVWGTFFAEHPGMVELAGRLTAAIAGMGGAAFVKLSTRSPKDSTLFAKRAASATGVDRWCEGVPMRVATGGEALALLVTSERVRADVAGAQALVDARAGDDDAGSGASVSMSIILRQWWHLPRWSEMRGFVRRLEPGGPLRLTALSEYFLDEPGDAAPVAQSPVQRRAAEVRDAVSACVAGPLDAVLSALQYDHAVVDFALRSTAEAAAGEAVVELSHDGDVDTFSVAVLELNSFGFRSDGALFDWSEEADALRLFEGLPGGGCEFRTCAAAPPDE